MRVCTCKNLVLLACELGLLHEHWSLLIPSPARCRVGMEQRAKDTNLISLPHLSCSCSLLLIS